MLNKILLVLLVTSCPVMRGAENWPQFRGPDGTGHSDARNLPLHWSETRNVVWKTAIHDRGWSSPVIYGKQIWLTSATKDGRELFALCIDRDTGKIIRDWKLFDVAQPQFVHMPPTHFPFRRAAAILSRVLSAMISRSNWAKESKMLSVSRPIE